MSDFLNQNDMNELLKKLSQVHDSPGTQVFSAKIIETGILLIGMQGRILGQNDSLEVISQISTSTEGQDLRMIIDLSHCSYLSSIVLGALARIAEKTIKKGKKICVFGANEIIIELFELTMFTEFIEICDSLEKSIAYLKAH